MLLELKDVEVYYDKIAALKGISLNCGEGMITTLIGANGAGKSTTLRVISGLKKLTAGEIWYNGKRIDNYKPHDIVKLGIAHIPEGRRCFGLLSVKDNLLCGSYLEKDKKVIVKLLDGVYEHFPRLKERQSQLAKTLSGGEQQMLAFGRALMAQPKLIVMDEPSLGLAPIIVNEIASMILQLKASGYTVILVEQNAALALKLSDTAYVLETGKVALSGASSDLRKNEHVKNIYLGGSETLE